MWGEPCAFFRLENDTQFQLTRPVWGEPFGEFSERGKLKISTHSPRVGRTNIRAALRQIPYQFQLTRPVWGEPWTGKSNKINGRFQLTRPVWGEPNCTIF